MPYINSHRYYHRLKENKSDSLLTHYANKLSEVYSGIIVCRNVRLDLKKTRLYGLFADHIKLFHHMNAIRHDQRSMFEVILGHRPQKPHFDIDVDLKENPNVDGTLLIADVVKAIIESLGKVNVHLKDEGEILIYTSSNSTKLSYHVVIDKWVHKDCEQARCLALDVKSRMKPEYEPFVDMAVYKSKQQFRLLWSTKLGTYRPKERVPLLTLENGREIRYPQFELPTDELMVSLISSSDGCCQLPEMVDVTGEIAVGEDGRMVNIVKKPKKDNSELLARRKFTRQDTDKMLGMLYDMMGVRSGSCIRNSLFNIREKSGSIISLDKSGPYKCIICHRQHENENPYLFVAANGKVYYNCRRAESSCPIGDLQHLALPEEESSSEEDESSPPATIDMPDIPVIARVDLSNLVRSYKTEMVSNAAKNDKNNDGGNSFASCERYFVGNDIPTTQPSKLDAFKDSIFA